MGNVIEIFVEETPNPNSLKFTPNRRLYEGEAVFDFTDPAQVGDKSPLAKALFELEGVVGVFLHSGFVTVSKTPEAGWDYLRRQVEDILQNTLSGDGDVISRSGPDAVESGDRSDVEERIVRLLEEYVRPAVARDGGDIIFDSFEDGTVFLHLRGSCHGCPSSIMTLKMGIERLLMSQIPEVKSVEALT